VLQSDFVNAAVLGLGFIPSVVNDIAELPPSLVLVPEDATYVTYSFLHGGLLHLGSNMLFLWVFGDNVEDAMGHIRFLIFYFACAAAGAFAHALLLPASENPLIGASGAVAGVVAAYLMLHPKVRVWVLVLGRIPLPCRHSFRWCSGCCSSSSWSSPMSAAKSPGPPMSAALSPVPFWSWSFDAPECHCSIGDWKAPEPWSTRAMPRPHPNRHPHRGPPNGDVEPSFKN
jgi:hypothetical protein